METVTICELVTQILTIGYLNLETENKLRVLLQTTKYAKEDINAFFSLQQAVIDGYVEQESRQLMFFSGK